MIFKKKKKNRRIAILSEAEILEKQTNQMTKNLELA